MSTPAVPFITTAPATLAQWMALFQHADLPVLDDTAEAIATLAEDEDAVDAHGLSQDLVADPLMTLKLLAHVADLRRGRDQGEPETVIEALVMLGIPPFFRHFGEATSLTRHFEGRPAELAGCQRVLRRARRAARFALGFAVQRMDYDAAVIHEAALLSHFAELLLWLRAPALALRIADRQAADPTLRSAQVQREVLNIELSELEDALMARWRLPSLLRRITAAHHERLDPQVENVQLAIRVARHSAESWRNPALPDDYADIARLLSISKPAAERLVHDIDEDTPDAVPDDRLPPEAAAPA